MASRRVGLLGAVAIVAMTTAGIAHAHECFNASRPERANAIIAQHSHGWFDFQTSQFLAIGLLSCIQSPGSDCPPAPPLAGPDLDALHSGNFDALVAQILGFAPAGPAVTNLLAFTSRVANEAACLGVPTHFLTLVHATAAGGAEKHGGDGLSDGRGIDHFPEVYGDRLTTAFVTVVQHLPSACH